MTLSCLAGDWSGYREGQPVNVCLEDGQTKPGIIYGKFQPPISQYSRKGDSVLYTVRLNEEEEIIVGLTASRLSQRSHRVSIDKETKVKLGSGNYLQLIARARRAAKWKSAQLEPSIPAGNGYNNLLNHTSAKTGKMFNLTSEFNSFVGKRQDVGGRLASEGTRLYELALSKAAMITWNAAEELELQTILGQHPATRLGARQTAETLAADRVSQRDSNALAATQSLLSTSLSRKQHQNSAKTGKQRKNPQILQLPASKDQSQGHLVHS